LALLGALVLSVASGWGTGQEAPATAPAPVTRVSLFDFESPLLAQTWAAWDPEATVALTHDQENVGAGAGALEHTYAARPGVYPRLYTNGFGAQAADTLGLKLKVSAPTSLSFGLQEDTGAQYQALLWLPADRWLDLRLPLADLILGQNATDDNSHLDVDRLEAFFLDDLANLPGETGQALGYKAGEQKLWVDDLTLVIDAGTRSRGRTEAYGDRRLLVVDDFESEAFWGLPIRQASLAHVPGAPKAPGQRGLELSYTLGAGRWVGFVMAPPGSLDLSTAEAVHVWAKTDLNARLVLVLEKRDGTKYDTAWKVKPDGKWQVTDLPLADFAPSDADGQGAGQLDAGQVHRIILLVDTFDADVRPGGVGSVVFDDLGLLAPAVP
jgi:hypothetical protein